MMLLINSDLNVVARAAEDLLRHGDSRTHMVVFDIDDTLLHNTSRDRCEAVPIEPLQRIYHLARALRIPIYLITAREDGPDGRAYTQFQLQCLGFTGFDRLYLRPASAGTSTLNISNFKMECRAMLTRTTGRVILLNAGDQWSDHFICTSANITALDNYYGNRNVLFKQTTTDAYSVWSLKIN